MRIAHLQKVIKKKNTEKIQDDVVFEEWLQSFLLLPFSFML